MKQILTSWLFFTSLLLLLAAASITLPGLMDGLLGSTEQQISQTTDYIKEEAQAVWAEFVP